MSVLAHIALATSLVGLILHLIALKRAQAESASLLELKEGPLNHDLVVVIPARNEAARLPATLKALLEDPSEKLKVFVYDDKSEDQTAALVKGFADADTRLHLLAGDVEPKEGHFGKATALARACERLAEDGHLKNDTVVLFLDADVILEKGALGGICAPLLQGEVDVVSGGPRVVCESVAEALMVPGLLSAVAFKNRPSRVQDPQQPEAFLNGQLIAIAFSTLHKAGGFSAVRDAILEDVALGKNLKAQGARLGLLDLRAFASTRMYRTYREIRAGFGKNLVPLLGGVGATFAVGVASAVVPLLSWAGVFLAFYSELFPVTLATVGALVLVVQTQITIRRLWRAPLWAAPLAPLSGLLISDLILTVAFKTLAGARVEWRDRSYRASRR
jgi:hypothetical protein